MLEHARRFLTLAIPAPSEGEFLNIHWSSKDEEGKKWWDARATTSVDEAIATIAWVRKMGADHDIYVCMSTQARFEQKVSKKGNSYRKGVRFQEDVKLLRSLYADIDVKPNDLKKGYADQAEALAAVQQFLADAALPMPSAIVASGSGGFHMHWVFDVPVTRDRWQVLADKLCAALIQRGVKCDTQCTIDSARILRIPDTFNWKSGEGKPVTLMSETETVTYEVMSQVLAPFNGVAPKPATPFEAGQPATPVGPASRLDVNDELGAGVNKTRLSFPIDAVSPHCGFIADALTTGGASNQNPLWFLTASVANFVTDGRAAFHRMSDQHPGYDAKTADNMFDRVVETQSKKDLGYPKCAKIASYGAPQCTTCPLFKLQKSPLNFVVKTGAQPAPDLNLPARYSRNADSIIQVMAINDDGSPMVHPLIHYPIYSGWLSSDPAWTLHFTTRTETGRKTTLDVPTEIIAAGKDTFAKYLGGRGWFCTEAQYKSIKEFFVAWLQKLQEAKDSVISAAPFGWSVVDGNVEGFAYAGRVWTKTGDRAAANPNPVLSYQYTPKGNPDVWTEAARIIYAQKRPALDAILAIGFAGPLVRFTGHGGLILNAYSPESGIGKTTAMKISQSVWGHPVLAMQGLNDTANSVLGKMGQIRSLPMYWDEIKSDAQIRMFCSIVFTMTGGREKTRMTQDAQLRMSGQWQTVMVSASNESLVDGMAREAGSTTAGLHRMFEYTVPPVKVMSSDLGTVQRLLGRLEDNYGHAGMAYAKFLGVNHERVEQEIAEVHDALLHEVTVRQEERMWVSTMAVLIKGAAYANELGLTGIDLEALKEFLLGVFYKNRADIEGSSSDLTNDNSAITVLGEMLASARTRNTIVTDRIWTSVGKPPPGTIKVLVETSKLTDIRVQIGRTDGLIRIASTFVSHWMSERGYSRSTWIKKMEQEFGLKKVSGVLGGGTDVVGAKEQLIELDMNNVKLSPFLE